MKKGTSLQDKIHFFEWLAHAYQWNNMKIEWIFRYLTRNESLLAQIQVVENAQLAPYRLVFRPENSEQAQIIFIKPDLVMEDIDQIFYEIKKYTNKPLYVEYISQRRLDNPLYQLALSENTFYDERLLTNQNYLATIINQAEDVLAENRFAQLKKALDEALDQHDYVKVQQLNQIFISLQKEDKSQKGLTNEIDGTSKGI